MHLSVEIKNICNEKDDNIILEILEASLLSRQWKLTHLTTAVDSESTLISRERAHLILKGARILEDVPEGRVEYSCLKIAKDHPESKADINEPPYSKFVTDDTPSLFDSIDPSNKGDKDGLIRSMFILRWKAHNKKSGRVAIGQHCLWLNCFGKTLSRERDKVPIDGPNSALLDDEVRIHLRDTKGKNEKDNVVVFRLEHSNYINHDFRVNKLCMIPVAINIVNCHGVPVKVFINMSRQQNRYDDNESNACYVYTHHSQLNLLHLSCNSRDSSGELGWAGALSSGLDPDSKDLGLSVTLEKFESRRVQVNNMYLPG